METLLNKYRCGHASEATHLSLIGGKFRIEKIDLFHRMYFKMSTLLNAYLVEKVQYPCRWYIDLDKQDPEHLSHVLKTILCRYGKRCVVSMPDTRDGAHVVFPNITVQSREDAKRRTTALLKNALDFDASVYSSGLRMIGSKKSREVARVYTPVYELTEEGPWLEISDRWTLTHLNDSSIFCKDPVAVEPTRPVLSIPTNLSSDLNFGFISPKYETIRYQIKTVKNYINVLTDSKFCMNIQQEHKNNRIYFVIHKCPKSGVVTAHVKCFCKCEHTGCANYKSKLYRMPMLLYFALKSKIH
jgi:hypothetical protein